MAIVVEDGTGLVNATSFTSVAFANAYHTARRNAEWTGASSAKETALIEATEFIETTFYGQWLGYPVKAGLDGSTRQALSFPRESMIDADTGGEYSSDVVPDGIQRATAELALAALMKGTLFPKSTTLRVARRRERAGRVELETWLDGTEVDAPTIRLVKQYLRPFLAVGGGAKRIDRA